MTTISLGFANIYIEIVKSGWLNAIAESTFVFGRGQINSVVLCKSTLQ